MKGNRCFVFPLRGLFTPQDISAAGEYLDSIWDKKQAEDHTARGELSRKLGSATDNIRFDDYWYDLWTRANPDAIKELTPYTLLLYPIQIRHIEVGDQSVPWHQDIGYQRMHGEKGHSELITCFVLIEEQPDKVPALEFDERNHVEMEHLVDGIHGAVLPDLDPSETTTFDLSCGDALVFGDLIPHRTSSKGSFVQNHRRSFEFRLISEMSAKEGRDYFDIVAGEFVKY